MKKIGSFINKKKRYLLFALLVGGIIYAGQTLLTDAEDESVTAELITNTVQKGTVANTVSASGTVETANYLSVTTSVNGIVEEVYVKEGDTVSEGDAIMKINLDSDGEESLSSAWSSYLSAKNSLESAQNSLYALESAITRAEEAFEDEKEQNSYQTHDERVSYSLAENDYLTAKADYDAKIGEITQRQTALNKAWLSYQSWSPTVTAPDSGVVSNIVVVEGMDISNSLSGSDKTSMTVASIKKEGTPIVSIDVSELDINNVNVGQEVRMELSSVDDTIFQGKVVGIDKIGATSSGVTTYTVIVKFDEETDLVLPGMAVDAEIVVEEKVDVVYVPTAAITARKDASYVTVQSGETETQVEVELGITDGTYTEIISGLNEGDQVLVASYSTSGFTSDDDSGSMRMPGMGGGMGPGR